MQFICDLLALIDFVYKAVLSVFALFAAVAVGFIVLAGIASFFEWLF